MTTTSTIAMRNPIIAVARLMRRQHPGMDASTAIRWARDTAALKTKWADLEFDTNGTARIERDGFSIHVQYTPDEFPDHSWIGKFSNTWEPGAIKNLRAWDYGYTTPGNHYLPWFISGIPAEDVRQWFHDAGHSHHDAWLQGQKQVRENLERIEDVVLYDLRVTVYRAGVELATDSLGGVDLGDDMPHIDTNEQAVIMAVASIDEAISEAKEAMKKLAIDFANIAKID